jgi:hypothetical protein
LPVRALRKSNQCLGSTAKQKKVKDRLTIVFVSTFNSILGEIGRKPNKSNGSAPSFGRLSRFLGQKQAKNKKIMVKELLENRSTELNC